MELHTYVGISINLVVLLAIGLLCVARPSLVLGILRTYSPLSAYKNLRTEGQEYDGRLRSTRHIGGFWVCLTLFMAIIVSALFYRSIPHEPKPSLFSNEPSLTHR